MYRFEIRDPKVCVGTVRLSNGSVGKVRGGSNVLFARRDGPKWPAPADKIKEKGWSCSEQKLKTKKFAETDLNGRPLLIGERNEGTRMEERTNKSTETDLNGRPLQMILDKYEIKRNEIKSEREGSWNGSL